MQVFITSIYRAPCLPFFKSALPKQPRIRLWAQKETPGKEVSQIIIYKTLISRFWLQSCAWNMEKNTSPLTLRHFVGLDWSDWSMRFQSLLHEQGLLKVLRGSPPEDKEEVKIWNEKDESIYWFLMRYTNGMLLHHSSCNTETHLLGVLHGMHSWTNMNLRA